LEVVRELLARGAAVDTAMNGGLTPLHFASYEGYLEVVRELLARGATDNGRTALSLATAKGHVSIVQLLRAHAAANEK